MRQRLTEWGTIVRGRHSRNRERVRGRDSRNGRVRARQRLAEWDKRMRGRGSWNRITECEAGTCGMREREQGRDTRSGKDCETVNR